MQTFALDITFSLHFYEQYLNNCKTVVFKVRVRTKGGSSPGLMFWSSGSQKVARSFWKMEAGVILDLTQEQKLSGAI